MKELIAIQSELKAPKNQRNTFGKYNYRSAEDILEALKPMLKENGCILTISDEMVNLGNRFYVKSTVTLTNSEKETVSTTALAREEEIQKGMNSAQITGSASSYARKYALNGLFCIDDTKDPDSTNTHGKEANKEANNGGVNYREKLVEFTQSKGLDMVTVAKDYKINKSTTNQRFKEVLEQLTAKYK